MCIPFRLGQMCLLYPSLLVAPIIIYARNAVLRDSGRNTAPLTKPVIPPLLTMPMMLLPLLTIVPSWPFPLIPLFVTVHLMPTPYWTMPCITAFLTNPFIPQLWTSRSLSPRAHLVLPSCKSLVLVSRCTSLVSPKSSNWARLLFAVVYYWTF